ncbi:bifunctional serine/threonine-protein kinase/formylglycine-generating enzyme family protein, partial [Prosthecobacter sp.]|uniref:bifunctional serine/threonine-protein kinase/formylglycine-generating enzyme family protein n=1 Tax=Prosthecobacter sp. TaxID=1965333 RepID=UPI0037C8E5AA
RMSSSSSSAETPRSSSAGAPQGWEPPAPEELQEMLPQYEITGLIGRGGMGAVYRGMQLTLDRAVAIKILPPGLDETDATYSERFRNEALAMAKLNHPGIVAVYDFGSTSNGMLYIVLEFVDGTDVAQMMAKDGRLPAAHAMSITAHVCDALKYAHERGIVHRDIKPANIMVGYNGVVKVADFGLAKMSKGGESTGMTQSGLAMGTMHYIAPEALTLGASVDHRADIYAMGVMLYHMLTGSLPQGMFELPSQQVPGLDPRYDGIISRALRNDRELRYQTVVELRRDLDAIIAQPVARVEANARQAPAALNTMERPQRPEGQPYRPPNWQAPPPPGRNLNLGFWVPVLGVVAALAGFVVWSEQGKAKVKPTVQAAAGKAVAGNEAEVPKPVFTNSLGMQFRPVAGTQVLMCIHETRNQDYKAYAAEVKGVNPSPIFSDKSAVDQAGDHPIRNVRYLDAAGFCEWLSQKEGRKYRLPTDEEWSLAMGIGPAEKRVAGDTPETLSRRPIQEFPWGSRQWPPPAGFGNYGDIAWKAAFPKETKFIEGYTDGFPTTAPVMSFPPNRQGLYDMSGNVTEWVQDWWNAEQKDRTYRGGGYGNREPRDLQPSSRGHHAPSASYSNANQGFRCVVERENVKSPGF